MYVLTVFLYCILEKKTLAFASRRGGRKTEETVEREQKTLVGTRTFHERKKHKVAQKVLVLLAKESK